MPLRNGTKKIPAKKAAVAQTREPTEAKNFPPKNGAPTIAANTFPREIRGEAANHVCREEN
jgi:hypothetical protein